MGGKLNTKDNLLNQGSVSNGMLHGDFAVDCTLIVNIFFQLVAK